MKKLLCELFINSALENIEVIMQDVSLLNGTKKEISLNSKDYLKVF